MSFVRSPDFAGVDSTLIDSTGSRRALKHTNTHCSDSNVVFVNKTEDQSSGTILHKSKKIYIFIFFVK